MSASRHGSVTPSIRSEDSQVSHLPQDLSLSELKALVEKKSKENYYLNIENDIFEKYLLRRDTVILKEAEQEQKLSRQKFEQEKSKARMSVPSSCHSTSSFLSPKKKITIPLKIRNEILVRDLEDMYVRHEKSLEVHERNASRLRCAGEELDKRCSLIESTLSKLRASSQIEAFGDVKKFIETTISQSNERIVRIGLKIKTMQSNLKCVKNELVKRIDPGNALKGIDFEIAEIENTKLTDSLQQVSRELLKRKQMEDELNIMEKKLEQRLKRLLLLYTITSQDTGNSCRNIAWLKQNIREVEGESSLLRKRVVLLKSATSILETPSILEHMHLTREIGLRSKELTSLVRKTALSQIMYRNRKPRVDCVT